MRFTSTKIGRGFVVPIYLCLKLLNLLIRDKFMMKNLFTLIALFCGVQLFAQATFSITPLNPSEIYGPDSDDLKAENHIVNNTNQAKTLRWERTEINLTPDCYTQVCDLTLCYSPNVSTQTFELAPGESGPLSVHLLLPDVIDATAVVRVKYYDVNNPSDSLISVYSITTLTTGTEEQAAAANIKLFPNPTVESFTLEHADMIAAVRIFGLDGRQVSRMEAEPSQAYSLAGLPSGSYIVALENGKGQVVRAMEVRKK